MIFEGLSVFTDSHSCHLFKIVTHDMGLSPFEGNFFSKSYCESKKDRGITTIQLRLYQIGTKDIDV